MGKTLDRADINRLMVAIHKAIVATFTEGDWRALGFQTDTLAWVTGHRRLLRSLDWKDEDYPDNALAAVTTMLDKDIANLGVMLENEKIVAWLRENDRPLYSEWFDGGSTPPADHVAAIHDFLWRKPASAAKTKGFRNRGHDALLEILRKKAEVELPGKPRIVLTQSLQDAGCDLVIEWSDDAKYGVQLKSHFDISEKVFSGKTTSQIQHSRQHGLRRLYVLLAGDLTDRSQEQKTRGLAASVSKMKDSYVFVVSPEQVWTLLFGE
jgi:AbiJ N-terminal domain 5